MPTSPSRPGNRQTLITAPREKFPCPAISLAQPFHHDGSGALQISPIRTTIKQPTERDERPFHVAHTVHTAPIKLLNLKLNQSSYLKIDAKRSFEWRFCSDVQTLANVAAIERSGLLAVIRRNAIKCLLCVKRANCLVNVDA